jgi:hypothetical protein
MAKRTFREESTSWNCSRAADLHHDPGSRGPLSAVGGLLIILLKDSTIAFYGAILSAAAITALFFGQRMAKDYAGAAVLVPYFLLALITIYLLAQ